MMTLKQPAGVMTSRQRLLQALAKHGGAQGKSPKRYAALGALPPYSETKTAEGQTGGRPNDFGAFQSDAFQSDGYQVEMF